MIDDVTLNKPAYTREEVLQEIERVVTARRREWTKTEQLSTIQDGLGRIDSSVRGVRSRLTKIENRQKRIELRQDEGNHLKELVTEWMGELRTDFTTQIGELRSFIEDKKFITIEMLDEHDFWIKEGIPQGMSPEEISAIRVIGREKAQKQEKQKENDEKMQRRQLQLSIIIPTIAVLLTAIGTTIAILTFLGGLHFHVASNIVVSP